MSHTSDALKRARFGMSTAVELSAINAETGEKYTIQHVSIGRMARVAAASAPRAGRLRLLHLLRPHWPRLTAALVAVAAETAADVLEPWPIKIVVDHVLQGKPPAGRWAAVVQLFGDNRSAILYFALAAVFVIAVAGA